MASDDTHVFGRLESWALKAKTRKARREGVGKRLNDFIIGTVKDLFTEADTEDWLILVREIAVDLAGAIDADLAAMHNGERAEKARKRRSRKDNVD